MRSKILIVLMAVLLVPLAGAFAEEPAAPNPAAMSAIVATESAPSCAALPRFPLDGAVPATWCSDMNCDYDLQCKNICGPSMCGGKCYADSRCGWKYCHCLFCP